MKIGLLLPVNGFKKYRDIYISIVSCLEKKGHKVVHPLSFREAMLSSWSVKERNDAFSSYYEKVKNCDLIIAECTYSCTNIGYEIANTIELGKKVIILNIKKDHNRSLKQFNPLFTKANVYVYEYQQNNLKEIISKALVINPTNRVQS